MGPAVVVGEMMKAPFPWFGGKSRVAHLVWDRFGNVANYVEPFAGSLADLLSRPHAPGIETVNDLDCFIANFWRALAEDPEAVAHWADWPVNEADQHARHLWLVQQTDFREQIKTDPQYFDARIAGYWVWGQCIWIGSGWCAAAAKDASDGNAGTGIHRQLPHLGDAGTGIHRKLPHLGDAGKGINRQLPHLGNAGTESSTGSVRTYLLQIAERMRKVRVCCGDWSRVLGPSPTVKLGTTGVFLDPPYADSESRTEGLYATDSMDVAHQVREWAVENGGNPDLRIALCGYEGEHQMPESWACVAWKARGGYGSQGDGRGRANAGRERIWFSPHCLKLGLFEEAEIA
jgi:site-specific DNA-adenine methylase